jgi:hypothetical protein
MKTDGSSMFKKNATMVAIWSPSAKAYVNVPFNTTYNDLVNSDLDFWYDALIFGWNEKQWKLPKFGAKRGDVSGRLELLQWALPHLGASELNEIVEEINHCLEAHRTA